MKKVLTMMLGVLCLSTSALMAQSTIISVTPRHAAYLYDSTDVDADKNWFFVSGITADKIVAARTLGRIYVSASGDHALALTTPEMLQGDNLSGQMLNAATLPENVQLDAMEQAQIQEMMRPGTSSLPAALLIANTDLMNWVDANVMH